MTQLAFTSSYQDDDGTFEYGTIVNKAFFDAIQTAINALVHSATNTGVTPADVIDEVVAARGSKADLDTRLDVSLNEDGTLKTQANLITASDAQSFLGIQNLYDDSRFEIWPSGDSSAPAGTTLSGTGAAVARTGTGLGDTVNPSDWLGFAAKITYGSATAKLTRTVVAAADFPTRLQGKTIGFGCWMRASAANQGSMVVDDGVTTTRGGESGNGTYHDGDSADAFVYGTHTMSGTATKLDVYFECAVSGSIYVSGVVVAVSDVAPGDWFPERWGELIVGQQQRGTLAADTDLNEFRFEFPLDMGILTKTKLKVGTAPTGQAAIWDVNKGGTSAYTTKPQIDAAGTTNSPGDAPDGTYQYRCFEEDDVLTWDCDQVGSGTAGAELTAQMIFRVPLGSRALLEAASL